MPRLSNVLVVEDEALIAFAMSDMLMGMGAQRVSISTHCDEAEHSLYQEDFDVALLDVDLGKESCERLVPVLEYRHVPFIVTTGFLRKSLPDSLQNRPYLMKPIDENALSLALQSI